MHNKTKLPKLKKMLTNTHFRVKFAIYKTTIILMLISWFLGPMQSLMALIFSKINTDRLADRCFEVLELGKQELLKIFLS